jgi:hypothetical protein
MSAVFQTHKGFKKFKNYDKKTRFRDSQLFYHTPAYPLLDEVQEHTHWRNDQ